VFELAVIPDHARWGFAFATQEPYGVLGRRPTPGGRSASHQEKGLCTDVTGPVSRCGPGGARIPVGS
jgi:hypothetical protein